MLTRFGMTPTEAKVYLELARSKETTMGPLIHKTGLHRGTVYNSINNLIKKGFVGFINESGLRHYKPVGGKIFENLIEDKKKELDLEKEKISQFILQNSRETEIGAPQVQVFHGVKPFKTLFLEIYDYCKKNNKEYLFQGKGGEMQDAVGEEFYKYTQKLKKKMKINCRIILDKDTQDKSYHKFVSGNRRYLSSESKNPVNIWIYGNTVLLVLFETKEITTIKVNSENLAESFRSYFEHLWQKSSYFSNQIEGHIQLMDLMNHAKTLKIFNRTTTVPYFFYPFDKKQFLLYRSNREKNERTTWGKYAWEIMTVHTKLWKNGIKEKQLVCKIALDRFFNSILENFGKEEFLTRIKQIRKNLKKYQIQTKVIDIFNPSTNLISDKRVMCIPNSANATVGFSSPEKEIIDTYNILFEEYWTQGITLEQYLDMFEREIRN